MAAPSVPELVEQVSQRQTKAKGEALELGFAGPQPHRPSDTHWGGGGGQETPVLVAGSQNAVGKDTSEERPVEIPPSLGVPLEICVL